MKTLNRTIYITQSDMTRLRALLESMKSSREDLKALRAELDQGRVVDSLEVPDDAVTMNSRVRLRDLDDGEEMIYTLVFPARANIDEGLLSVLAPVGTAVLGHRVGDIIEWPLPAGAIRLRVEEILYQPEAAGDYRL